MSNRSNEIKNDDYHGKKNIIMVGCFILGSGITFNFDIGDYNDVTALKKAIWEYDKDSFESIGVKNEIRIKLWKVEIPTRNNDKFEELLENPNVDLDVKNEFDGKRLNETWLIKSTFTVSPPEEHIHIIVQPPPATTEHIQKKRKLWHNRDPKEIFVIQGSSNEVRKVPVSQSEFKIVRENNLIYIDKTPWLTKLDLNCGQYFVSRPRKFGKSMFLSMVESFFLAQHDLFKDLYISEDPPEIYVKDTVMKWNEPNLPPIPVIRLDFSDLTSNEGPEVLKVELIQSLKFIGNSYGITLENDSVKSITKELITSLADHEENVYKKVVILVDEYDSPILSAFNATKESLTVADQNRAILKGFFEMLKASQKYIKFCLVTGVTMFSNMELFSGANQLTDMTMRDKLSGAYGFMEDEIVKFFESKFSGDYSDIKGTMTKLREKYNGYSWDGQTKVYNPYSICSFFDALELENFWIKKGRTSFLSKLIRIEHIKNITNETTIKKDFIIPVSIESIMNSTEPPISLLFQAGYLTIKQIKGKELILEMPNSEVRDSLVTELWANSSDKSIENASRRIEKLADLLKKDSFLSFLKEFNNDLASIPFFESQHASKYEGYYHSHMHMLVRYIGLPFRSEDASCTGRTDMWIETLGHLYFIEYKRWERGDLKKLIEEATNQIFERKYYASLTAKQEFYSKTKHAIGCVFSTKTRMICGVGIQKFTYESNSLDKKQLEISLFEPIKL